jgi:hypothetical protein
VRRTLVLATTSLFGCQEVPTETYRDPEGAFVVEHPSGLRVEVEKGSAVFSGIDEGRHVTVTIDAAPRKVKGWSQTRDLKLASDAMRRMLTSFRDAKLVEDRETTLNGLPAWVLTVKFRHADRPYRRRQFVVEAKTVMGYFALTGPVDGFEKGEPVAAAMLETLELSGGDA